MGGGGGASSSNFLMMGNSSRFKIRRNWIFGSFWSLNNPLPPPLSSSSSSSTTTTVQQQPQAFLVLVSLKDNSWIQIAGNYIQGSLGIAQNFVHGVNLTLEILDSRSGLLIDDNWIHGSLTVGKAQRDSASVSISLRGEEEKEETPLRSSSPTPTKFEQERVAGSSAEGDVSSSTSSSSSTDRNSDDEDAGFSPASSSSSSSETPPGSGGIQIQNNTVLQAITLGKSSTTRSVSVASSPPFFQLEITGRNTGVIVHNNLVQYQSIQVFAAEKIARVVVKVTSAPTALTVSNNVLLHKASGGGVHVGAGENLESPLWRSHAVPK